MTKQKTKYIRILIFLFILTNTLALNLNAQVKTPYQKKVEELNRKFLIDIGVSKALIDLAMKSGDNMAETIMLFPEGRNALNSITHTQDGKLLIMLYAQQLTNAEKLKNEVDYKKEKEKKEKEGYAKSDMKNMKNDIKREFNSWLQRDQFEKSDEFSNRIKNNAPKAFDSICEHRIISQLRKYKPHQELLKYNADSEKFGIKFNYNIPFEREGSYSLMDSLKIPFGEAINFKKRFENLESTIDINYLNFVDNNLRPQKAILYNRNEDIKEFYEISFSAQNSKKIQFSTLDLGINLEDGSNLKFDYDQYVYERAFIMKDNSQINSMAWNNLLNKNYSKALQILERAILLIDKTDETYSYILGNLAHAYLLNNNFEKAHQIYFENLSLKLNNMSWKQAVLKDFEEFKTNGIQSNNIEKIKKELEAMKE